MALKSILPSPSPKYGAPVAKIAALAAQSCYILSPFQWPPHMPGPPLPAYLYKISRRETQAPEKEKHSAPGAPDSTGNRQIMTK